MSAPFRALRAATPAVTIDRRADGAILLRHPAPLGDFERTLIDVLRRWARERPDQTLLAARVDGEWRRVNYSEARAQADRIAQGLLDCGAAPGDRLMMLSGNSIEHALMMFGAMTIGVATAPISPPYSLLSQDFDRLKSVHATLRPSVIFIQNGRPFERALRVLDLKGCTIVAASDPPEAPPGSRVISFETLAERSPTESVEAAYVQVTPDTIGKILFTSGSTGSPKGVINTHRMMCANIAMADAVLPPPQDGAPNPTLSWLPWNHTAGGNALFNLNLMHGETYFIDDGLPLPSAFSRTIANLREVSPRSYMDVPAGLSMLADALDTDADLRRRFFSRLEYLWYAGASLPQTLADRIQALATQETGHRIPLLSGYGSTETAPGLIQLHWPCERAGVIGLPLPGVEVKLMPLDDDRYAVRMRGPTSTPGYYNAPDPTRTLFDEEGYLQLGDAVRFVDIDRPEEGLCFAGRLAEDFKLLTGTFVPVGAVRAGLVSALAPYVRDAIITGHDRDSLGALIWLNVEACRTMLGGAADRLADAELAAAAPLRTRLAEALKAYNRAHPSSSMRVARLLVLTTPPSIEHGEITDKAYVNQSAALRLRADEVEALYADPPRARVILPAD